MRLFKRNSHGTATQQHALSLVFQTSRGPFPAECSGKPAGKAAGLGDQSFVPFLPMFGGETFFSEQLEADPSGARRLQRRDPASTARLRWSPPCPPELTPWKVGGPRAKVKELKVEDGKTSGHPQIAPPAAWRVHSNSSATLFFSREINMRNCAMDTFAQLKWRGSL